MSRSVDFLNEEPRLELEPDSVRACIAVLDRGPEFAVPPGSLEIAFVDLEACCRLHGAFFGDPDPTDVMTFPGDPEDGHAGDVAVCPAVAAKACRENGTTFPEELTLYLVHGWLHLAGLDDRDEDGRAGMRRAEALLMERLAAGGALLACRWSPPAETP